MRAHDIDPGWVPSGRPARVPRVYGVRHRQVLERYSPDLISAPIVEPLHHVRNVHRKETSMYDRTASDPRNPPERVMQALARVVSHCHRPGTVGYADVGAAADLVALYFDTADVELTNEPLA